MKISLNRKKGRLISLPVLLLVSLILSACGNRLPSAIPATATQTVPAPTATSTRTAAPTATPSPLPTATATVTPSPTATLTPTVTPTPTITPTPTQTLTPTFDFPDVIVQMQANCRYGPGTAYLYSFGLYQGDTGMVGGRNYNSTWLWIKPSNLDRYCWVSSSVVQIQGDVNTVRVIHPALPHTTFAGPPGNVQVVRSSDQVRVSWDEVPLSEDKRRGYLLEANVCQNGDLFWMAVQTDNTSYEFTDQQGCKEKSSVLLYTAEKHGYSDPVQVPWP